MIPEHVKTCYAAVCDSAHSTLGGHTKFLVTDLCNELSAGVVLELVEIVEDSFISELMDDVAAEAITKPRATHLWQKFCVVHEAEPFCDFYSSAFCMLEAIEEVLRMPELNSFDLEERRASVHSADEQIQMVRPHLVALSLLVAVYRRLNAGESRPNSCAAALQNVQCILVPLKDFLSKRQGEIALTSLYGPWFRLQACKFVSRCGLQVRWSVDGSCGCRWFV